MGLALVACSRSGSASPPVPGSASPPVPGSASPPVNRYPLGVTEYPEGQRQPLPPVTGKTVDGGSLALSSLRGHVVVLNVWASWCEPCQSESPELAAVATSRRGSGVSFVGLDENDEATAATAFLRRVGASYPQLVDQGPLLAQLSPWLPTAVPSTLVVDARGRIAARIVGAATGEQVQAVLTTLTGHNPSASSS